MEKKQKSHIRPIVYVMISVFLIIGYAYLTSNLTINGASLLKKATWDVHFENVQVKDGSVTGDQVTQEPEIDTNKTTVSFHVNLKKPGDYYEFTVDAVNAGTIDAMINSYTEFDLTEDQLKYLETSVTYEDGEEIAEKQQLLSGDFAVYKIVVSFKKDLEADDLPSNPEQLDLEFTVEYVQKDDTAIERRAETNSLYNVLKRESESGSGLAKLYTGAHQDSFDASKSTKNIYHWYAADDTAANSILKKRNVLFANHCWWMIRTTDTGGTKLLYNGEADNGECLTTRSNHVGYSSYTTEALSSSYYYGTDYQYDSNSNLFTLDGTITSGSIDIGKYTCKSTVPDGTCSTLYYVYTSDGSSQTSLIINGNSNYSQFGKVSYNVMCTSPADVGYMYNTRYTTLGKSYGEVHIISNISVNKSSNYYYGTDVTYDSSTGKYTLTNQFQDVWSNISSSIAGSYTCLSTTGYTCNSVYYIAVGSAFSFYGFTMKDGHFLDYYNTNIVVGKSFTKSGGVYTLNQTQTIARLDWVSNHDSYNYYYSCGDDRTSCDVLHYITSSSSVSYRYIKVNDYYVYANDFSYDSATDTYTLGNDRVEFWNNVDKTNKDSLNNHHYTCFNTTGECNSISYIFRFTVSNYGPSTYYINLENGKSAEDVVNEMLYNNDVNSKDSIKKFGIEAWYKKYMSNYTNYIEDIIYCNDRTQSSLFNNGWNPNGGKLYNNMEFYGSDGLSCQRDTDKFSVSNPIAHLTYPVGLISRKETSLFNSSILLNTNQSYHLGSPRFFSDTSASVDDVSSSGSVGAASCYAPYGVRPSISLKPGTIYISGDGSMANPYVIDTN